MTDIKSICRKAKTASSEIAKCSSAKKEEAIDRIARKLLEEKEYILENNKIDLQNARQQNKPAAFIDRLVLDDKRIESMCSGLKMVAQLPDPIGKVDGMIKRPNGLYIGKKRIPLGVIGIIYESRPNVTIDASSLCFKAGNAVVLRGGSEAINSNKALVKIFRDGLQETGISPEVIQLVENTSRAVVLEMMKERDFIDVLIPRGGKSLISAVVNNSLIPVIETGEGNCHIFIDKDADKKMAEVIVVNAKTTRPAVCNAAESLLVSADIAPKILVRIIKKLQDHNVEIRGCEKVKKYYPNCRLATEDDWYTEYLDYIIAVKVVQDIDEAIKHINKYSTHHSEVIVTNNYQNAQKFLEEIDSAAVFVNASSRFTDGAEFGMGAEIGISTQKLHARGPMGVNELTTYKYIIYGNGQIR
ncbi:MAG: glutamate-5-semialdehyde dehydrogenase [Atribacterota bacterium]|nr:glutamate-5-semialdehyde dehydrogenase [Atribacterota bacterium]